ncbi:50S ribosomal protein L13 [bacterium]|nr:50S ribosomal protein L13 [bacterium]|tara:strand:+ start:352 stop:717 length:366 start_codon:yes stop_codon:yes gene_type:complete
MKEKQAAKEHTIDAKGKRLGRLASEIAIILQGKKSPHYERRLAGSDKVIVKNIEKIEITGKKFEDKLYYKHTGPLGHLKEKTYKQKFEKKPAWVLEHAVRLMLPKNRLQKPRMKRLIIEQN